MQLHQFITDDDGDKLTDEDVAGDTNGENKLF